MADPRIWLAAFMCLAFLPMTATAEIEGEPCSMEPTDDSIEYGHLVVCSIGTVADADFFHFFALSGEKAYVALTKLETSSASSGVEFVVRRPNGTVAATNQSLASARAIVDINQTGEWSIQVEERLNDSLVDYALVLERVVPPSPTALALEPAGALRNRMIAPFGDVDVYSFQGAAGTTVSIRSAIEGPVGPERPCVHIYQPDGTPFLTFPTCGGPTANIVFQVAQDGPHAVVATEASNQRLLAYSIELTCLSGNCPSGKRPVCEIALSAGAYFNGDFVTVDSWRLANPGPDPIAVEIKTWFVVPGGLIAKHLNAGADGSLIFPVGLDVDVAPLTLFEVLPDFPRGNYSFSCRLLNPTTGETIQLNVNTFVIQ